MLSENKKNLLPSPGIEYFLDGPARSVVTIRNACTASELYHYHKWQDE